jgi:hypothetical protein
MDDEEGGNEKTKQKKSRRRPRKIVVDDNDDGIPALPTDGESSMNMSDGDGVGLGVSRESFGLNSETVPSDGDGLDGLPSPYPGMIFLSNGVHI